MPTETAFLVCFREEGKPDELCAFRPTGTGLAVLLRRRPQLHMLRMERLPLLPAPVDANTDSKAVWLVETFASCGSSKGRYLTWAPDHRELHKNMVAGEQFTTQKVELL